MLMTTPTLDAADLRVIDEIEEFRHSLRHQLATPPRWEGQLRRTLTAGAIRGSNSIEGYTISESDAEALVAGESMLEPHDRATVAAVEGYRDALTWVQQAATFDVFSYDWGMLSTLHFMMTKDHLLKWPGRYRSGPVWVSGGRNQPPVYTAPDAERVPNLMDALLEWLNSPDRDIPVFVRAAMAHLNLVKIHPWRDGNGRMSRCLHTLVLARDRIVAPEFSSIEEWLGLAADNTGMYYMALRRIGEAFDPDADTHDWVRFCLRTHHLQAQVVDRRVRQAGAVWTQLAELAERHELHERVVTALYASIGGHLRRSTYQLDENLTRDQAVRDLQLLKRLRLIEPIGQGRTARYLGGDEVRRIADDISAEIITPQLHEPYPRPF